MCSSRGRTTSSAARRRWPLPLGLGGILCFRCGWGRPPCWPRRLTPEPAGADPVLARDDRVHRADLLPADAALALGHDISSLKKSVPAGEALPDAPPELEGGHGHRDDRRDRRHPR
ncbi:hypothetical protein ACU4GD_33230 [Cupriavidus basilensis]